MRRDWCLLGNSSGQFVRSLWTLTHLDYRDRYFVQNPNVADLRCHRGNDRSC